jgi:hypothetical protein
LAGASANAVILVVFLNKKGQGQLQIYPLLYFHFTSQSPIFKFLLYLARLFNSVKHTFIILEDQILTHIFYFFIAHLSFTSTRIEIILIFLYDNKKIFHALIEVKYLFLIIYKIHLHVSIMHSNKFNNFFKKICREF